MSMNSAAMANMIMSNPQMMNQMMGMTGAGGMGGGMGDGGGQAQMMAQMMNNGNGTGSDMMNSASTMAMQSGNPEVAIGLQAANMYGKYNAIYTIIIFIILAIFCWWVLAGMFCGSSISTEEGFELSGNWSNSS